MHDSWFIWKQLTTLPKWGFILELCGDQKMGVWWLSLSNMNFIYFFTQFLWEWTPKIAWDQKLVNRCLGSLCEEFLFFFSFLSLAEWSSCFKTFPGTPSTSNSNSIWAWSKVLFKMGIKFIFLVSFEEPLHVAMWLKLPRDWRTRC